MAGSTATRAPAHGGDHHPDGAPLHLERATGQGSDRRSGWAARPPGGLRDRGARARLLSRGFSWSLHVRTRGGRLPWVGADRGSDEELRASRRVISVVAVVLVAAAGGGVWLGHRLAQVDDPASARCDAPTVRFAQVVDRGDHREVVARFRCGGTTLAGTVYLPRSRGSHPGVVWVHGAGEAPRLGFSGELLPSLVA